MPALVAEARSDTRKLDRAAQEGLAHAFAVGRKIIDVTLGILVINRAIGFAVIGELGGEDAAVANLDVVLVHLFIDDAETIAPANIQREIDVPAENCRQVHDYVLGDIGIILEPIPKFPEVRRDLSMIIDRDIKFERIKDIAFKSERKILKSVSLFDVYESDKLGKGKKSYAVGFILQNPEKTLTDKEIDRIMDKIQANLEKEIHAEIRMAKA